MLKAFNASLAALEATRGTATTTPVHWLNTPVMIKPRDELLYADEDTGTTFQNYRAPLRGRQWSDWETGERNLDLNQGPFWGELAIAGGVTPTLTAAGVYLWTYKRSGSTDNRKTADFWGWDPAVQRKRIEYAFCRTFALRGEHNGLVKMAASGQAKFPVDVTVAAPAKVKSRALVSRPLFYLDTGASAFGTSPVTGKLVNWGFEIPNSWGDPQHLGTTADMTDVGIIGYAPLMRFAMRVASMTEYNYWTGLTEVKLRMRIPGELLDATNREFLETDIFGVMRVTDLGEFGSSHHVLQYEMMGEYETGMAADYSVKFQNSIATIS